MTKRKRQGS